MSRTMLGIDVLTAARQRIEYIFDNFEKIYVSYSGGKDSTVMTHLVAEEAIKRGRKFGLLCIDFEAQYKHTYTHVEEMYNLYQDNIIPYWVCLPMSLDNAVSEYEPRWTCWDEGKDWIRPKPKSKAVISDEDFFPFYERGMEFEEFVHEFGKWYSGGDPTAVFIGIRTQESYNRLLKLRVKHNREFYHDHMWILKQKSTEMPIYSTHPIYDWKVEDVWRYHGLTGKAYNRIYDLMNQAGLTLHQQRLCQPYGIEQRKGLWLFQILEPDTWSKVVARVNGANSGAEFVKYSGNVSGQIKIYRPDGHTWQSFAMLLIQSMPEQLADHYDDKIFTFIFWWTEKGGYTDLEGEFCPIMGNIPDEVDPKLEAKKKAPSWRRICKVLLRHDYWCKGLTFVPNSSAHHARYKSYLAKRKMNRGYIPLWER